MHADRFRGLVDAAQSGDTTFVSVYFDDSHDTADAAAQLDARLRDIRKHLEDRGVDDAVIEVIDTAVRGTHPPVGRSGRGIVAHGARIVLDEQLAVPPVNTLVRVSELPYLVPVVEHGMPHTTYLSVAVDSTGADITVHEVTAHRGSRQSVAHTAEAGTGGGPQGHAEEAVRRTIRDAAEHLTQVNDRTGAQVVFITGEVAARAELVAELPERVAAKAVQLQGGGRGAGTDPAEVAHEIAAEFERRRHALLADAADRFHAGHGSGLAVDGLGPVTTALRDGAVQTLILGDLGEATLVADHDQLTLIGTDAQTVSALGGSPDRVVAADEALPLLAVSIGAALVRADESLTLTDGVGAVLRYADPNAG